MEVFSLERGCLFLPHAKHYPHLHTKLVLGRWGLCTMLCYVTSKCYQQNCCLLDDRTIVLCFEPCLHIALVWFGNFISRTDQIVFSPELHGWVWPSWPLAGRWKVVIKMMMKMNHEFPQILQAAVHRQRKAQSYCVWVHWRGMALVVHHPHVALLWTLVAPGYCPV